MSRILLADDSPHAQRMGERILREEGFEVVTVTDGDTALIRMSDVDPDLVMADVFLPHKSGYEICEFIKSNPKYRHARVVLLAGLLEPVNDAEVQRVKADAVLKKPLEASAVVATVKPLIEAASAERGNGKAARGAKADQAPVRMTGSILGLNLMPVARPAPRPVPPEPPPKPAAMVAAKPAAQAPPPKPAAVAPPPKPAVVVPSAKPAVVAPAKPANTVPIRTPVRNEADAELVRAAVTVALDRAMPALIDEITGRVLEALRH